MRLTSVPPTIPATVTTATRPDGRLDVMSSSAQTAPKTASKAKVTSTHRSERMLRSASRRALAQADSVIAEVRCWPLGRALLRRGRPQSLSAIPREPLFSKTAGSVCLWIGRLDRGAKRHASAGPTDCQLITPGAELSPCAFGEGNKTRSESNNAQKRRYYDAHCFDGFHLPEG
jgi:hypothetical protein